MPLLTQPGNMNDELVAELISNQDRLQAYIFSLTADRDATRDILQATNLVIWEKSSDYMPGTNFVAWAFRIARYQVFAFRRKQSRDRLVFSDGFVSQMADAMEEDTDEGIFKAKRDALAECLQQLPSEHLRLISLRYRNGMRMREIAAEIGKSTGAVEQKICRLRSALFRCISRRLAGENRL